MIDVGRVIVHFDQEPGTRYVYDQAAFDYEEIPKKPAMPSVRRAVRSRARRA